LDTSSNKNIVQLLLEDLLLPPCLLFLRYNGYLLPIRGLVDARLESFPEHKWADPDPEELERLMKYLKEHQNEAKQKGEQARRDVAQKWSNNVLSQVVAGHLERLTDPPSSLSEERDEL